MLLPCEGSFAPQSPHSTVHSVTARGAAPGRQAGPHAPQCHHQAGFQTLVWEGQIKTTVSLHAECHLAGSREKHQPGCCNITSPWEKVTHSEWTSYQFLCARCMLSAKLVNRC